MGNREKEKRNGGNERERMKGRVKVGKGNGEMSDIKGF
jgi:hypothetical protein